MVPKVFLSSNFTIKLPITSQTPLRNFLESKNRLPGWGLGAARRLKEKARARAGLIINGALERVLRLPTDASMNAPHRRVQNQQGRKPFQEEGVGGFSDVFDKDQ
jgi:hypothetical protein